MTEFESKVFELVKAGDADRLKQYLASQPSDQPVNLNFRDDLRRSPLHWAVEGKSPAITKILLAAGCRPKGIDSEGFTPLHMGIWKRNIEIVEALLEAGADPNFCSENTVYAGMIVILADLFIFNFRAIFKIYLVVLRNIF